MKPTHWLGLIAVVTAANVALFAAAMWPFRGQQRELRACQFDLERGRISWAVEKEQLADTVRELNSQLVYAKYQQRSQQLACEVSK